MQASCRIVCISALIFGCWEWEILLMTSSFIAGLPKLRNHTKFDTTRLNCKQIPYTLVAVVTILAFCHCRPYCNLCAFANFYIL